VTLDAHTCHRALTARDVRFDGVFFVGVETTGVYCRPICPARTPGFSRCSFFVRAAEAERAGFRACLRCRPELAPGLSPVESTGRLVTAAVTRIEAGYLNEHSIEDLAGALGVTSRHLRRVMESEIGVSPVELAQTRRLALAKQLLQDTVMPVAQVAFAAGFSSVRRFNALVLRRFGRPPSDLRRTHGSSASGDVITLRLDYRPPFDWDALLEFLRIRAIPGVETTDANAYRRSVVLGDRTGWIDVQADAKCSALRASVSLSLAPHLMNIVARLRQLFDLDARPDVIAQHLQRSSMLRPWVRAHPGLRVPGAFDAFETAVRAVLGQQVSVRGATTLSGRLVERFGRRLPTCPVGVDRAFPTVEVLANASVAEVREIGLPEVRARTLVDLACAIVEQRVELSSCVDPKAWLDRLQGIVGIGPWTAHYLAMRVLRWPDAFPANDLAVKKALGVTSPSAAQELAEPWRPWRAYAAMHLWNALCTGD
jgi:AraC family transcriptional regulator, regulatory protein of adaptative response / DNA-3-methyladenine glycosylase II